MWIANGFFVDRYSCRRRRRFGRLDGTAIGSCFHILLSLLLLMLLLVRRTIIIIIIMIIIVLVLVQINRPSLMNSLDVESLAQNADLAPRVPVGRNQHFVAVDHVVLERLAFQERVDVQRRVDECLQRVRMGAGGID